MYILYTILNIYICIQFILYCFIYMYTHHHYYSRSVVSWYPGSLHRHEMTIMYYPSRSVVIRDDESTDRDTPPRWVGFFPIAFSLPFYFFSSNPPCRVDPYTYYNIKWTSNQGLLFSTVTRETYPNITVPIPISIIGEISPQIYLSRFHKRFRSRAKARFINVNAIIDSEASRCVFFSNHLLLKKSFSFSHNIYIQK